MYRIGFTGTQKGLSTKQSYELEEILWKTILDHPGSVEFRHGDCIGADFQAHAIFHDLMMLRSNGYIVIHPPSNPEKRAYSEKARNGAYNKLSVVVLDEKPYLERDQDIVDWSDVLIACPHSAKEQQRSGTWATVRKARRAGKRVIIIDP